MKFTLRALSWAILLALAGFFCGGSRVQALDTVPLRYMDVLEPAYFFRARSIDPRIEFSGVATTTIQGIRVSFRNPKDMRITYREADGIDYIHFAKDGVTILECAIKPRNPQYQMPDGEPFNSMKKVGQVELLKNIIIRGAATDTGDGENILPNIPKVTLAQNTRNSFILEARHVPDQDGEAMDGMGTIFEGCILLGRSCLPISAAGHANEFGIKPDGLFLAWLNNLLDTN